MFVITCIITSMARNSLLCADVPLRNYSLTHSAGVPRSKGERSRSRSPGRSGHLPERVIIVSAALQTTQLVVEGFLPLVDVAIDL